MTSKTLYLAQSKAVGIRRIAAADLKQIAHFPFTVSITEPMTELVRLKKVLRTTGLPAKILVRLPSSSWRVTDYSAHRSSIAPRPAFMASSWVTSFTIAPIAAVVLRPKPCVCFQTICLRSSPMFTGSN